MTSKAARDDVPYVSVMPDAVEGARRPVVGLAVPAGPFMDAFSAIAMLGLGRDTKTVDLGATVLVGQDPAQSRNQMARNLLRGGIDAVCFMDADMLVPTTAIDRMWAHGLDIVGADYRKRAAPFNKIGWRIPGVEEPEGGLVERGALGLGLLLVRRHVFEKVPQPWFARIYNGADERDNGGIMTEDYWFCLRAREAGFKIWCDLDVTKDVMHIGQQPVPWHIPAEHDTEPQACIPEALVNPSSAAA